MKKLLLTALIASTSVFATDWELAINSSLTGGFNTYSSSWVGEEQGNIVWKAALFTEANRQFVEKFRMENSLEVEFGQTFDQIKDSISGNNHWSDPKISSDKIDFNNREIMTLKGVSPYFGFRSQTNFMNQFADNKTVQYLNPVKLTESFGISKKLLEKVEKQSLEFRFSAAGNQSFDRNLESINDMGLEFITAYSVDNKKGYLGFKTNLNLFKALAVSDENIRDAKIGSIDMDWQSDAYVNINRFIVITYTLNLNYNEYISNELRTKSSLTAGFNFVKSNKEG